MEKNKLNHKKRDELLILLQNSSNLRIGQDQVVWSIFGAFWGTNALLLISLFSVGGLWNLKDVGIIISSIGIFISFIWTLIQIRSIDRIIVHENSMIYIENKLKFSDELRTYSKPPIESFFIKIKARTIMRYCCILVMSLWMISLIIFVCSY